MAEKAFPEVSPTMPPHFPNQADTPKMRQDLFVLPPFQKHAHIQYVQSQHTSRPPESQPKLRNATQQTSSDLVQHMQQATQPSSVAKKYDCMPQCKVSGQSHSPAISQPQQQPSFKFHWPPVLPCGPQQVHINKQQRASSSTDFQRPGRQNQQTPQPLQQEEYSQQTSTERMPEQELMFVETRSILADQSSFTAPQHTDKSHNSAVILLPPSPFASARLDSAQSNSFARPLAPSPQDTAKTGPSACRNNITTPVSALPSRFITSDILQSPSSF